MLFFFPLNIILITLHYHKAAHAYYKNRRNIEKQKKKLPQSYLPQRQLLSHVVMEYYIYI